MNIVDLPIWHQLIEHKYSITKNKLSDFFNNAQRFDNFSLELDGLLFDFSKQYINLHTIELLSRLADELKLQEHIDKMFSGGIVNVTEGRPAMHVALRDNYPKPEIKSQLDKMAKFCKTIYELELIADQPVLDVICLGIGGSELGPNMASSALKNFAQKKVHLHFLSNIDQSSLDNLLDKLNPASTICLISSKSFTTLETMLNAKSVKDWFSVNLNDQIMQHMFAITANPSLAKQFGILEDNIFLFWDWVGGRFSIWSSVGLPLMLSIGPDNFNQFLLGANCVDQHFKTTEYSKNIPIIMGLIGIWNINFLNYNSLAVIPYSDALELFPSYLQQLEMESNGKIAISEDTNATYATAPVIWGGVGCNNQHAYMQLLHQGSQIIPVDFILPISSSKELVANCLAQSRALLLGNQQHNKHLNCDGNRPSSTIAFNKITPYILGQLIAIYEHKVFVQGAIWQIQSFDQWGVQLGKGIANDLINHLTGKEQLHFDCSTQGLIDFFTQKT